jgi:hypothetical protein
MMHEQLKAAKCGPPHPNHTYLLNFKLLLYKDFIFQPYSQHLSHMCMATSQFPTRNKNNGLLNLDEFQVYLLTMLAFLLLG